MRPAAIATGMPAMQPPQSRLARIPAAILAIAGILARRPRRRLTKVITPLPIALSLILVAAMLCKRMDQSVTAFFLLGNWALSTLVVEITGNYYPVWCLAPIDYITAIGLFICRRSHWQSVVMGVYAAQLVCHAAYVYSGMGVGPTYYSFWLLTYLARLQAAIVGGWIAHDIAHSWLAVFSRRYSKPSIHQLPFMEEETL